MEKIIIHVAFCKIIWNKEWRANPNHLIWLLFSFARHYNRDPVCICAFLQNTGTCKVIICLSVIFEDALTFTWLKIRPKYALSTPAKSVPDCQRMLLEGGVRVWGWRVAWLPLCCGSPSACWWHKPLATIAGHKKKSRTRGREAGGTPSAVWSQPESVWGLPGDIPSLYHAWPGEISSNAIQHG